MDRALSLERVPLGRTLRLALVGLTLVLAAVAAVAMAELYGARQRYERELARTYQLESVSSRLLAAGVIEESTLGRRGGAGRAARRRAERAFAAQAAAARRLAAGDARSAALVRRLVAAQTRARRAASKGRPGAVLARALTAGRAASAELAARQRARRDDARANAGDDTRVALLVAAGAGGLALVGALLLIGGLLASIRRPLDDLVGATRRLAEGVLGERVEPRGPQELSDLGGAFNAMAEQLEAARRRVDEERRKLKVTIESLGDALVVCDTGGVVSAVNPRAEEVAPTLRPGTRADGPGSPLPPLDQALRREVLREEGPRTLSITAARLGRGDEGVVWTLRDVSERVRLERLKSDFVATASHELRSPLASIKGFVELLGRSRELRPRERESVQVILKSTDRLVELVNDLLDVTRLEAGRLEVHPRRFDLGALVEEVAGGLAASLTHDRRRLDVHVPPGLPPALADPARVRQVVANLLAHARRQTGEGGRVAVSLRRDGGALALDVSDSGAGMTPDELERVFDRFGRVADGARGAGVGLSIVKSLVELQRGSIEVRSEPGEGSVFTVRLPAGEPARGVPR